MRHSKEKGDEPDKDLENGDAKKEGLQWADGFEPEEGGGEYDNLVKYISTYRDRRFSRAPSSAGGKEEDATKAKGTPKWKFWAKAEKAEEFEAPDEWLGTDINTGLTSADVENRRKKTGFNELTTEKENLFLKFLGYFQGPILYGTYSERRAPMASCRC